MNAPPRHARPRNYFWKRVAEAMSSHLFFSEIVKGVKQANAWGNLPPRGDATRKGRCSSALVCFARSTTPEKFERLLILSQRHTWRFYTPIAANLIASENRDFFRRSWRCGSFENWCNKIAQPDGLAFLAIRSNKRRKSRERVHLANAGEFNRRYLTCQILAILYADRGDRRIKSPSVSLALG